MITNYIIDFKETFSGAMLLSVEPKMTRADKTNPNSSQEQAKDKEGVLKWTVTVAVETEAFGNKKFENIPITVTSPNKPFGAIPPGTSVTVERLEMGIMMQTNGKPSIFYSATAIQPLQPAPFAQSGQSSRSSGQPLQSARMASGQ